MESIMTTGVVRMHGRTIYLPLITSRCVDCGLGCDTAGERFMVTNAVEEEAWPPDRLKPWHAAIGQTRLCVGCLEQRLGRTLCANDFVPSAGVNDPAYQKNMSDRLRQRLTATESVPLDPPKRKRGRPLGSKDKRKRRPWGSKKRPK
jgi:hypothetical protein